MGRPPREPHHPQRGAEQRNDPARGSRVRSAILGPILTAAVLLVCLLIADVIGALACTFFDVMLYTNDSPAAPYAIWFVLGVFSGLFTYLLAGGLWSPGPAAADWTKLPGAHRIGLGVIIVSLLTVVGLSAFFYRTTWSKGVEGEYYVPDSEPHSLVFLVAVLGAMIMGRFMLMPTPDKPG